MRIFWVGLFGLWVCAATAQEVDMGATLPPGSPHEYYQAVGQETWPQVALKDEDVVNLVNLRFLSEHYRCPPHVVMELRAAGQPYDAIEREVAKRKKVE